MRDMSASAEVSTKPFTPSAVQSWFKQAGFGIDRISRYEFDLYRDALLPVTIRVSRDGLYCDVLFGMCGWQQKCYSYEEIKAHLDSWAMSIGMSANATRRYVRQLGA